VEPDSRQEGFCECLWLTAPRNPATIRWAVARRCAFSLRTSEVHPPFRSPPLSGHGATTATLRILTPKRTSARWGVPRFTTVALHVRRMMGPSCIEACVSHQASVSPPGCPQVRVRPALYDAAAIYGRHFALSTRRSTQLGSAPL
jgi:hypothetical protein